MSRFEELVKTAHLEGVAQEAMDVLGWVEKDWIHQDDFEAMDVLGWVEKDWIHQDDFDKKVYSPLSEFTPGIIMALNDQSYIPPLSGQHHLFSLLHLVRAEIVEVRGELPNQEYKLKEQDDV